MKLTNFYVYIITNLITGRRYVGSRVCHCEISKDSYMGSSKYLSIDYEKYGLENFSKEIIETNYHNKLDMLISESNYILEYNTLEPHGYNRFLPNKRLGFCTIGCEVSDETKQKMSISAKKRLHQPHSIETKQKISASNKGKKLSLGHIEKLKEANLGNEYRKGKFHSEESKQKMRNAHPDKNGENNPFYNKTHTIELKEKWSKERSGIPSNRKGCLLSEETKLKMKTTRNNKKLAIGESNGMFDKKHSISSKQLMSQKAKNKKKIPCKYCKKTMTIAMHNRWHGEKCKKNN